MKILLMFALVFCAATAFGAGEAQAAADGKAPAMVSAQPKADNGNLLQNLATLSELRTQAESRVRLLKGLHAEGEIDAQSLRRAQLLYEDARAAMNAWLDAAETGYDIAHRGPPSDSVPEKLQLGARRAGDFLSYADKLILGESRGSNVVEAVVGLVSKVIDAGVTVWKDVRTSNDQRRKQIALDLDRTRWPAFESIVR